MWVLLTFLFAVVLIYLEFFLPGGILGVLGAISLLTSMVMGFTYYGASAGMAIMVGELTGATVLLILGVKMFPHTRIGRLMIRVVQMEENEIRYNPAASTSMRRVSLDS